MRSAYPCRLRGDDRTPTAREVHGRWVWTPPVFRRRTIRLASLLGVCFLGYAALLPFGTESSVARLTRSDAEAGGFVWRTALRADVWANVAVYIPIGLLGRLAIRRRPVRPLRELALTCVYAAALSVSLEYMQIGRPGRAADVNDVLANTAGAAIGAFLAPAFQSLMRTVHAAAVIILSRIRVRRVPTWVLFVSGVGLLALGMAPFYLREPVAAPAGYAWLPLHSEFPRAWLDWLTVGATALVTFAAATFLIASSVARIRGRASTVAVATVAVLTYTLAQTAYWQATGRWADSVALVLVLTAGIVTARAHNAIAPHPTTEAN